MTDTNQAGAVEDGVALQAAPTTNGETDAGAALDAGTSLPQDDEAPADASASLFSKIYSELVDVVDWPVHEWTALKAALAKHL